MRENELALVVRPVVEDIAKVVSTCTYPARQRMSLKVSDSSSDL